MILVAGLFYMWPGYIIVCVVSCPLLLMVVLCVENSRRQKPSICNTCSTNLEFGTTKYSLDLYLWASVYGVQNYCIRHNHCRPLSVSFFCYITGTRSSCKIQLGIRNSTTKFLPIILWWICKVVFIMQMPGSFSCKPIFTTSIKMGSATEKHFM